MDETRRATVADAETIGKQRMRMFVDAGLGNEAQMASMILKFVTWVRPKLSDETYIGWLVEDDGRLVAGAGLWVMDFPPNIRDEEPHRAYLMNFYVAPEMRRKGMARKLLKLAVDEAEARKIKVVTLHASKFGKPLYEQNGFEVSNEMRLRRQS